MSSRWTANEFSLTRQSLQIKGRLLRSTTVSKIAPPQGAIRVDGRGRYLMPGLADMHTHTWAEADFLLFLANGVTTIRNMWGSRRHLIWRKRIASREMLGPTIFTAGPIIDGSPPVWNTSKPVVTAEEARGEYKEKFPAMWTPLNMGYCASSRT